MKQSIRPLAAFTALVLASSALFTTAHGIETTAKGNSNLEVYSSLKQSLAQELGVLSAELDAEMILRADTDTIIRGELNDRINNTNARITALENRLPGLATQIEGLNTTVTAELTILKAMITALRTDMDAQFAALNSRITSVHNEMTAHAANLQSQINTNNTRINDLYTQVAAINARITNLNNFLNDINNRLAGLRACVANGSCVRQSAPTISLYNDVAHWAGWEFWGSGMWGNVWNTGIATSTYQYCSVSGNTGMGGRDFYVYQSGGYWHMANERDNAAGGDESGMLYMNCMRIT